MKFLSLAKKLRELEKTDSRNQMTEKLAKLLGETAVAEVAKVVYLALGRLRPKFDDLEFNLAEKQVVKCLARVAKKEVKEVTRIYKLKGDLGIVAQELKEESKAVGITVGEVYDALEKIAKDQGQGSQERKIEQVTELINRLDGLSARYVVRVIMGKLRLGFSDKTILDAISWMEKGDKSAKNDLEKIYLMHPDVGWIAEEVKDKGIKRAAAVVRIALGVPISPMLCQRLKSTEEMVKKMGRVAVEPKFDGTRVAIHYWRDGKDWQVKTFTRNLEENSWMFPELMAMGKQVTARSLILDTEAVGFDPQTGKMLPFQLTITRKRKHGVEGQSRKVPLKFFVFDIVYKDGKSLAELSYVERRRMLKATIKNGQLLVVDDYWEVDDPRVIRVKHEELLKQGLEGVIVKRLESKYVPGRTGWRWVKMKEVEEAKAKLTDTIDGVVMGFYRGKGKRTKFGLGAFLVGVRSEDKYLTVTKVGTGLTDDQFKQLKRRLDSLVARDKPKEYIVDKNLIPDVWVEPELVVELAADEVTKSPTHSAGVALRFPRLVRFRDDKGATEASEIKEIRAMGVGERA